MDKALRAFAPLGNENTKVLVLGSFPSERSLQMQQYYAHPQNQFWHILGALWHIDLPTLPYEQRCAEALRRGLGIWDVYASCERQGSLDSAIHNATVNDFAALARQCPQLQAIAHNGSESWRHHKHAASLGLPVYKLPSTSPANASWSFERKLQAWREVFMAHGLCAG
ncbi:MAG: DNA-deoxyinosine glycosylase [Brachymonas sp.]|nr:DNA-deoxyinosine glycosylase [Brachymonas sp.]